MRLTFSEPFELPVDEVYSNFRTPRDWARLYGLAGELKEYGDGWVGVPLKRFPFPLVAKTVVDDPNRRVRWVFRGFWRGEGEVNFEKTASGVRVTGYEDISIRWLFFLSPIIERLALERAFRGIWEFGWRRLRKQAARNA